MRFGQCTCGDIGKDAGGALVQAAAFGSSRGSSPVTSAARTDTLSCANAREAPPMMRLAITAAPPHRTCCIIGLAGFMLTSFFLHNQQAVVDPLGPYGLPLQYRKTSLSRS